LDAKFAVSGRTAGAETPEEIMVRPDLRVLAVVAVLAPLALVTSADAQSALANCKYYTKVQQDFEQGLEYCRTCIEEEPDNPEARFYGAWALAEMGEWEPASESFWWLVDRAEDKDKNVRKHAKMADQRIQGYYTEHFNKGVNLIQAGEDSYPAALEEFKIATTINPKKVDAFLNLGFVQNSLGQLDEALQSFETAIQVNPDSKIAYDYYSVALGNKRNQLVQSQEADAEQVAEVTTKLKDALARVIENDPAKDAALLQLGDLAMSEGKTEEAIAYINKAIEIDPGNVVNLYNIAVGLHEAGSYEAAAQIFEKVAVEEGEPTELCLDAQYNAALCYKQLEQWDKGLVLVQKLLEANPDSPDYHSLASQFYLKTGDLQKASEHMQEHDRLAGTAETDGGTP
jgi:tetratricopeptide (TPR) repeat protein